MGGKLQWRVEPQVNDAGSAFSVQKKGLEMKKKKVEWPEWS